MQVACCVDTEMPKEAAVWAVAKGGWRNIDFRLLCAAHMYKPPSLPEAW
jgi:hypothetical protein